MSINHTPKTLTEPESLVLPSKSFRIQGQSLIVDLHFCVHPPTVLASFPDRIFRAADGSAM